MEEGGYVVMKADRHTYKDYQQTAKVRRGGKDSPQAFRGSLANSLKPPALQTPASRIPGPDSQATNP